MRASRISEASFSSSRALCEWACLGHLPSLDEEMAPLGELPALAVQQVLLRAASVWPRVSAQHEVRHEVQHEELDAAQHVARAWTQCVARPEAFAEPA